MADIPSNGGHPSRLEKVAESAYGRILQRWVWPPTALLLVWFVSEAWSANMEFQKESTKALQTIQIGLAVTVQQLNSNTENDQRQDREINRLEDRINAP